jgi:hypothetical protein
MSVKNSHCVRCCEWCDGLYDVSLSDAPTDKKYCSAECENEYQAENGPQPQHWYPSSGRTA